MQKYLVSRPKGGLNDILCQIAPCWNYAEKYGRYLIIDTELSGLLDGFGNYFELREPASGHIHFSCQPLINELIDKSHYPDFASIDASRYRAIWGSGERNYVGEHGEGIISFDFTTSYDEDVLIHHQCGGGDASLNLLSKLKLSENVCRHVKAALDSLPEDYVSVHVRNTDLKTDYKEFFESIAERVKGKSILLCSDDRLCVDYGRDFFDQSTLLTVSDIPDTDGAPLHMNANIDRFQANLDMITDLVCLANGKDLHLTRVARGFLSGFSRLAQNLHKNRDILDGLTASPDVT